MTAIKPESPLAMLKPVAERHGRLRVVTRHSSGVRGVAVGFLIAFDRYMNLLMRVRDPLPLALAINLLIIRTSMLASLNMATRSQVPTGNKQKIAPPMWGLCDAFLGCRQ